MSAAMDNILDNVENTDMTISVQGREIPVHKAIVCGASPVFAAALQNGFKEAHTSRIDLPEDDYNTIRCLLDFCYRKDYQRDQRITGPILQDIKLFVAADKYGVCLLKELTRARIIHWLSAWWWPAVFPAIVRDIWYAAPPDETELRDMVTRVVVRYYTVFLREEPRTRFLSDNPELSVSIVRYMADGWAAFGANEGCVIL